jgi:hypothetical protein
VARALASLVLIKAEWFPLIITRDQQPTYIQMLEKADAGDLKPLIGLLAEAQRNALIKASEVAYEIQPPASLEPAITAIVNRMKQRRKLTLKEWLAAKETANRLLEIADAAQIDLAVRLRNENGQVRRRVQFGCP